MLGCTPFPYDDADVDSIVTYARKLEGTRLRDYVDRNAIANPRRQRGVVGNLIERYYFLYKPNNDKRPDFPKVGLELKVTPMKLVRKNEYVAKERLVITDINYYGVIAETYETSHFFEKASSILLAVYLWEPEVDPLDYVFKLVEHWHIPPEDAPQLKADWETVVAKVKDGHAEDISSRDTLYLEACTKASDSSVRTGQPRSDVLAKPRAWALKKSYMTIVENKFLENMETIRRRPSERDLDLLSLVQERFQPYLGKTEAELAAVFGYVHAGRRLPKDLCALITKRILGVDEKSKITEFEKAGIKPKTIRVKKNGVPKESVSFPAFDYVKLAKTPFEDSDFYGYLQQRYLFVIYCKDAVGEKYRLSKVLLWQMPESDYGEAKRCYEEMQKHVIEGHAEQSVSKKRNRCCHTRPHSSQKEKPVLTPQGDLVGKKCFWLNNDYIASEIAKASK